MTTPSLSSNFTEFLEHLADEVGRRRVDLAGAHILGMPATFLTGGKLPCHDPDLFGYLGFVRARRTFIDEGPL